MTEAPNKFMQVLHNTTLSPLRRIAKERGVTVQELIRAAVVPDWLYVNKAPINPAQLRVYLLKKEKRDYARGWKAGKSAQKHKRSGRPRQR